MAGTIFVGHSGRRGRDVRVVLRTGAVPRPLDGRAVPPLAGNASLRAADVDSAGSFGRLRIAGALRRIEIETASADDRIGGIPSSSGSQCRPRRGADGRLAVVGAP